MRKHDVTLDTVVYVSTWGWRNCDPCGRVIATTRKRATKLAYAGMRDDARHAVECDSEHKTIKAALRDIAWYGVHAMRLGDLVNEGREAYDAIQGLDDDGYTYID